MSTATDSQAKKLILLVPVNFSFQRIFEANARRAGFDVYLVSADFGDFRYPSLYLKLKKFFRKTFLGDKTFKQKLIVAHQKSVLAQRIESFSVTPADYALFIRPDLWDYEIVEMVTRFAKFNVCYQWDGMQRYPAIDKYIPLFNKFLVFDPKDMQRQEFHPALTTNFYFDHIERVHSIPPANAKERSLFYIGTYEPERMPAVMQLLTFLSQHHIKHQFILLFNNRNDADPYKDGAGFEILFKNMPYDDMIDHVQKHDVIIDFQNRVHKGLSFRVFESLYFQKKLITDNEEIAKYEFYDPANIFIMNSTNLPDLIPFMQGNYKKIDPLIVEKYSFSSWIKRTLSID